MKKDTKRTLLIIAGGTALWYVFAKKKLLTIGGMNGLGNVTAGPSSLPERSGMFSEFKNQLARISMIPSEVDKQAQLDALVQARKNIMPRWLQQITRRALSVPGGQYWNILDQAKEMSTRFGIPISYTVWFAEPPSNATVSWVQAKPLSRKLQEIDSFREQYMEDRMQNTKTATDRAMIEFVLLDQSGSLTMRGKPSRTQAYHQQVYDAIRSAGNAIAAEYNVPFEMAVAFIDPHTGRLPVPEVGELSIMDMFRGVATDVLGQEAAAILESAASATTVGTVLQMEDAATDAANAEANAEAEANTLINQANNTALRDSLEAQKGIPPAAYAAAAVPLAFLVF